MKHFVWRLLVTSGVLLAAIVAGGATRPRYGGVLRVAMQATPKSLDPADTASPTDDEARAHLWSLICETLVTVDGRGVAVPNLASSWETSAGDRRWQFRLRKGITFADGQPLTAEAVAGSLRALHSDWRVEALLDAIVIQTEQPQPGLLAELALARNGVFRRDAVSRLVGTGPFAIADWQPGKKATLTAVESYWGGRAFLDSVEIELGKGARDQMIALDLGRTDLAEIPAEQVRRALSEGRRVVENSPTTLIGLVFSREAQSENELRARRLLARTIDRNSVRNVLFQGHAESADSLLPNSMTGYAFLLKAAGGSDTARPTQTPLVIWNISFDAADPLDRVIAERIALNARDAGVSLQLAPGNPKADVRLARFSLPSADPWLNLRELAMLAGLPLPRQGSSLEELYQSERGLLETQRLIPVVHVSRASLLGAGVRNWRLAPFGDWPLDNVWVEATKK